MKRLVILSLCLSLFLFAGCGSDESAETKAPPVAESDAAAETAGNEFTETEYVKFIKDIPEITKITNPQLENGEEMKPEEVARLVIEAAESLGWGEERFMYVYTQAMTVLSLEQLNQMEQQMAAQMAGMPEEQKKEMIDSMTQQLSGQKADLQKRVDAQVSGAEQGIIRAHLGELYEALGIPQQ